MRLRAFVITGSLLLAGCATQNELVAPSITSTAPPPSAAVQQASHVEPAPEQKIILTTLTLPEAIQLCVTENFRLRVGAEKIRQAEADVISESTIPNPTIFTDYQLIPLQTVTPVNQAGPPQFDFLTTLPIDWLLFGKRAAAMQAAKLGVDVAGADFADLTRRTLADTIDTFYELLDARETLELSKKNYEFLQEVEKAAKARGGPLADLERLKLAVMEAKLDVHGHELDELGIKARLRPMIGRTAADPDFNVAGSLAVRAVVPVPKLEEAIALAEAHRPDLISDHLSVAKSDADLLREQRRGAPKVEITPGYSYQVQRSNGYPNASLFNAGLSVSLPLTDRNQGQIAKAKSLQAENRLQAGADRAYALAEVETILGQYDDAVEDITENNDPATLASALKQRDRANADFAAGRIRLVELLDAQASYRQRAARSLEFEATYWRVLNRLNAAVGLQAFDEKSKRATPVHYPNE